MFTPNASQHTTSRPSGKIIEMTMSVGLRRKRRISRSMMARVRCMVSNGPAKAGPYVRQSSRALRTSIATANDDRALGGGLLLQRVAKRTARVVHEDIVERGALHRQRLDGDVGRRGPFHHRERGGGH